MNCKSNQLAFIKAHLASAQKIAAQLGNGVTAEDVLAISGNETHWGGLTPQDGFARFGNYFGLHASGSNGAHVAMGSLHPSTPIFDTSPGTDLFLASGQAAIKHGKSIASG